MNYKEQLKDLYLKINDKTAIEKYNKYISNCKENETLTFKDNIKNIVESFEYIVKLLKIDSKMIEDMMIHDDNVIDISMDCYELKSGYVNVLFKDDKDKSIIIKTLSNAGGIAYYNGYREIPGICINTYTIKVNEFDDNTLDKYSYDELRVIHRVLLNIVHAIISYSEKYINNRNNIINNYKE